MLASCHSPARKHVVSTMKQFHFCTHLPIKALDPAGQVIHTEGYTARHETIFQEHQIRDRIDRELDKKDSSACLLLSKDKLDFTVVYICPKSTARGVYVIGPYTPVLTAGDRKEILYKPANCLPHLITLLRQLAGDSKFIKHRKECSHSLHVKKALQYIENNYSEPITVDTVARELGISKSYFCALFKKDMQKTFTQFLNQIRIEKSKRLLTETELSILDIAITVGYNNQNYYNMLFKKLTALTPYQYRHKYSS